MRLAPIEKPPTLLGRALSYAQRRVLGKTITPAKVVYNRVPRMWNVSFALVNLDLRGFTLPHELLYLMHVRISLLNGCAFCQDIVLARAVQEKLGLDKFRALADDAGAGGWRASPLFSERERAALAYAEEATLHKDVSDETFGALQKHFSEREIAELVVETAKSNFYNLINVPLRIPDDGLLAIAQRKAGAV
jgi:alkylhydroperoxidase family enzyme